MRKLRHRWSMIAVVGAFAIGGCRPDWRERLAVEGNIERPGEPSLHFRLLGRGPDTVVVLNDHLLVTNVDPSGKLVTATVPKQLTALPGELTMRLHSPRCEETTPPITVKIEA